MQGLLRHSASIWSGLGGLPYPTAGLDVIVYNSTYEDGGTTYYRTSKGIGLPVISGTGLDTIIDFAPLNDVRFDKGSYVGNAYGLPEYYNFPYVGIYYDATSEATRYHWKITDFHYANILAQSLLVDNMFFLKAKATTNTSNVIATWDKLFIYTTALADNNLAKMKTYINLQDDYVGYVRGTNNIISLQNAYVLPLNWIVGMYAVSKVVVDCSLLGGSFWAGGIFLRYNSENIPGRLAIAFSAGNVVVFNNLTLDGYFEIIKNGTNCYILQNGNIINPTTNILTGAETTRINYISGRFNNDFGFNGFIKDVIIMDINRNILQKWDIDEGTGTKINEDITNNYGTLLNESPDNFWTKLYKQ